MPFTYRACELMTATDLGDDQTTVAQSRPYYLPLTDEVEVFRAAYAARLPILLKGPTGCGKTRFVEHMTWLLNNEKPVAAQSDTPLITVSCHEDLTATDMIGRYLLKGDETIWSDGPLTRAVRSGSICYLDEIVEARKDTTVLIHSLTDHRRILPIDKTGELIQAHNEFLLVISYNPGYQNVLKDLKTSTRQRFIAIDFDYPSVVAETDIIAHESGVDREIAGQLAALGAKIRHLREHGFDEGVSTRLLIYAGQMMVAGVAPARACDVAICRAVSDDTDVQSAMQAVVQAIFADTMTG